MRSKCARALAQRLYWYFKELLDQPVEFGVQRCITRAKILESGRRPGGDLGIGAATLGEQGDVFGRVPSIDSPIFMDDGIAPLGKLFDSADGLRNLPGG